MREIRRRGEVLWWVPEQSDTLQQKLQVRHAEYVRELIRGNPTVERVRRLNEIIGRILRQLAKI